jgi:hypothetical protein
VIEGGQQSFEVGVNGVDAKGREGILTRAQFPPIFELRRNAPQEGF